MVSRVQCLEQNTADRADIVSRLDQTVTRSEQLGKEVSQIKEDIKLLTELVGKLGSAGGGGGGAGGGNSAHQGSHEDEDETSELNLLNCSQVSAMLSCVGVACMGVACMGMACVGVPMGGVWHMSCLCVCRSRSCWN